MMRPIAWQKESFIKQVTGALEPGWQTGHTRKWRGGRVAEGAPLLREYTGDRIEGSNPFLSASRPLTVTGDISPSLVAKNLPFLAEQERLCDR